MSTPRVVAGGPPAYWARVVLWGNALACFIRCPFIVDAYSWRDPPRLDVHTLELEDFDELVVAGQPFIVTGVLQAGFFPGLSNWSCAQLAAHPVFRNVEVKREYDVKSAGPGWVALRDLPDPPLTAYYWAAKDGLEMSPQEQANDPGTSPTWSRTRLVEVQRLLQEVLPPFLRAGQRMFIASPEFWISGPKTGALPHMDTFSVPTITMQLAGRKRWRLELLPPRSGSHVLRLFEDGNITSRGEWEPTLSVELQRGDLLIFPPGTIHETYAMGDGCAVSLTAQFDKPWPATFFRHLLGRVLLTPDLHHVWPELESYLGRARQGLPPRGERERAFRSGDTVDAHLLRVADVVRGLQKRTPDAIRRVVQRAGGVIETEVLAQLPLALRENIATWEAAVWAAERSVGNPDLDALEGEQPSVQTCESNVETIPTSEAS